MQLIDIMLLYVITVACDAFSVLRFTKPGRS